MSGGDRESDTNACRLHIALSGADGRKPVSPGRASRAADDQPGS
jgi:hypothetical protein